MTEFANLIQNKRKEKGYTLEELANKLGVDKSYISKLENNRVPAPSVNFIRREYAFKNAIEKACQGRNCYECEVNPLCGC